MAAALGDSLDLSARAFSQDPSAPDPVRPHAGDNTIGIRDELNDPLQSDVQIDDVFRDTNNDGRITNTRNAADDDDRGLGIDEEVKVRKPRAKQAKLDETRLLSAKGIPTLRRITKEKIKFRGKGHEFSDVSRLLNQYQIWLDDLFPKAKFADGLAIIEKLGHTRRMQVMRKEWIEEGKPKPVDVELSDADDEHSAEQNGNKEPDNDALLVLGNEESDINRNPEAEARNGARTTSEDDEDDLYTATTLQPVPTDSNKSSINSTVQQNDGNDTEGDELDQLLAEDAGNPDLSHMLPNNGDPGREADFDDDEEAMANIDMGW